MALLVYCQASHLTFKTKNLSHGTIGGNTLGASECYHSASPDFESKQDFYDSLMLQAHDTRIHVRRFRWDSGLVWSRSLCPAGLRGKDRWVDRHNNHSRLFVKGRNIEPVKPSVQSISSS
jgi:hypothetical protein